MEKSGFIKKADLLLIALILVCCAAFLLPKYLSRSETVAVIYSSGEELARIDLASVSEPYVIDLHCIPTAKITVEPGSIYYSYAECHDKLCINSGVLSRPGDTAACLPSETLVVIEGKKSSDMPDVITY